VQAWETDYQASKKASLEQSPRPSVSQTNVVKELNMDDVDVVVLAQQMCLLGTRTHAHNHTHTPQASRAHV
jgi:hypothetical protein